MGALMEFRLVPLPNSSNDASSNDARVKCSHEYILDRIQDRFGHKGTCGHVHDKHPLHCGVMICENFHEKCLLHKDTLYQSSE